MKFVGFDDFSLHPTSQFQQMCYIVQGVQSGGGAHGIPGQSKTSHQIKSRAATFSNSHHSHLELLQLPQL